jgi:SAM-dependent methyltransferase
VLSAIPSNQADIILLISVLEHLVDPVKTLGECHRLLKPGGTLLVNVPTWRGKGCLELAAFRLGLCPAEEIEDHKAYYDKRSLWPQLVAGGFRPSGIQIRSIKFGLTLFATAKKPSV